MKRTFTVVTEVDSEKQFEDLFFAITLALEDRSHCGDERGDLIANHVREFRLKHKGVPTWLNFHKERER